MQVHASAWSAYKSENSLLLSFLFVYTTIALQLWVKFSIAPIAEDGTFSMLQSLIVE